MKARDYAGTLAEIFGPERFYIEIQDHGIKEQKLEPTMICFRWPASWACRIVATNDVHYVRPEDSPIQDLFVCVQTNTTLSDPKRLKRESDQLYFKSPQEMWDMFKDAPEALSTRFASRRCVTLTLVSGDISFRISMSPKASPR